MVVAHCVGPATVLVFTPVWLGRVMEDATGIPDRIAGILRAIAVGLLVSSVLGFPFSVMRMVWAAFRNRRDERAAATAVSGTETGLPGKRRGVSSSPT